MADVVSIRDAAWDEASRIVRFALAGVANTALGGAVIVALQLGCGVNPHLANAGGYAAGLGLGFVLNRAFVFRSQLSRRMTAWRYTAAAALAFAANQACLAILAGYMTGPWSVVLVQGAAVATYTATLFLLSRFWVFVPGSR